MSNLKLDLEFNDVHYAGVEDKKTGTSYEVFRINGILKPLSMKNKLFETQVSLIPNLKVVEDSDVIPVPYQKAWIDNSRLLPGDYLSGKDSIFFIDSINLDTSVNLISCDTKMNLVSEQGTLLSLIPAKITSIITHYCQQQPILRTILWFPDISKIGPRITDAIVLDNGNRFSIYRIELTGITWKLHLSKL